MASSPPPPPPPPPPLLINIWSDTGTGRMLELFASRYERALGVDLSPAMLSVARANLERASIDHARVRLGDVMNLPVVRDSFDLVVIHQVLHFLDEPNRALTEAAAALSGGGRLLIVDFAPHELEHLSREPGASPSRLQPRADEAVDRGRRTKARGGGGSRAGCRIGRPTSPSGRRSIGAPRM